MSAATQTDGSTRIEKDGDSLKANQLLVVVTDDWKSNRGTLYAFKNIKKMGAAI